LFTTSRVTGGSIADIAIDVDLDPDRTVDHHAKTTLSRT
jgi:hypothetical protein